MYLFRFAYVIENIDRKNVSCLLIRIKLPSEDMYAERQIDIHMEAGEK